MVLLYGSSNDSKLFLSDSIAKTANAIAASSQVKINKCAYHIREHCAGYCVC